ncbi:uncharacterized protein LOC128563393 [Nycticebus coucang]|uniref:uncharacterized protein LOC128563393 n=1 Tax=Nycticebus coucang TaxID=9470 RepID=UPI00234CBDB0|nr:uncharacterized protein LOC128563393 [Nycticebus coucang]
MGRSRPGGEERRLARRAAASEEEQRGPRGGSASSWQNPRPAPAASLKPEPRSQAGIRAHPWSLCRDLPRELPVAGGLLWSPGPRPPGKTRMDRVGQRPALTFILDKALLESARNTCFIPVITWEAEARGLLETRSLKQARATEQDPVSTKIRGNLGKAMFTGPVEDSGETPQDQILPKGFDTPRSYLASMGRGNPQFITVTWLGEVTDLF